jgi:Fe-S cluster biogenesis protein NfuA
MPANALTCTATFTAAPVTYPVTVAKAGTGSGTVGGGGNFAAGATVTLTATPATGSTFAGWAPSPCAASFTMPANALVCTGTFTAAPVTYRLTVTKAGTGTGTVSGNGIACGTDCVEDVASGTRVPLTAAAAAGSVFAGWSGACTGTAGCEVTMDALKTVTATFNRIPSVALTVVRYGSGTVTSTPAGISCGTDCREPYPTGTSVTLTATPAAGYVFGNWSGACTGTGACVVTMNTAKRVTATFRRVTTVMLTVVKQGNGTVTSQPAGINCGTDCREPYAKGTIVELRASAAAGSTFRRWGGACSGSGVCRVPMNIAKRVTAVFVP